MKLSKQCKDRLCTLYKNESEKIIYRVENLIDLIKSKYHLKNISFITNMSYNIILSAYSDEWKNVIVKIGIIKENINREILFYYNYQNNDKCCEIYTCDREEGYIIMKKIEPGLKLDSIKCLDERLKIFKQVYNNINNKYDYTVKLPKYKTILYKEFDNFNIDFLRIYIEKAKKYYRNIERLNMPKYILHGDLHHWNILKETNCWKIIDPVGFIGEKIFDTVVFLQNEFWKNGEDENNIITTVEKMCNILEFDKEIVYQCLYINITLTVIWNIKDNESERLIQRNVKLLNIIDRQIVTKV